MSSTNRPYRALRHRDYRRLVGSQLFSLIGSQMQTVALNWHIYLLTRSPLALGFVGLTRVVPIIAFSLWAGVVADRYDRRRIMIATQLSMTAVALALSGLTFAHCETLWALYGLNVLSAAAGSFDNPARHALLPRLVPAEGIRSRAALGGVEGRAPVGLPDAAHGLDDRSRLPRHVLFRFHAAAAGLRGPGPEGRREGLWHSRRGAGDRRSRRLDLRLVPPA